MTDATTTAEEPTAVLEEAYELVLGLWSGQLLYAAVELGILDHLADGPTTAEAVAGALDLDTDRTYRLLRALGYYDVVEERPDRRFALAPVGECFLVDHPGSVRADLRFVHSPEFVSAMVHLPDIVSDGGPDGFEREFGRGLYEYAEDHPRFGGVVNAFMTARLRRSVEEVLDTLDSVGVGEASHVCDVGGGHGYLLARLLETHPSLEGTVLDLSGVVEESDRRAAPAVGVTDRCRYVAGDMFEAVPTADAYLLKEILHNWDDEACVEILSTVHDAAPSAARLFVVEAVVPGPGQDHFAKRLDMTMMVHLGGRERTEAEYATLLERAGWEHLATRTATSGRMSVIAGGMA